MTARPFREMGSDLARRIRLIVSDVDGTLTAEDDTVSQAAVEAMRRLEEDGVVVGLASGRAMPRVDSVAARAEITGPLIGENGAIARLRREGALVDLGYSREPALRALERLKQAYPGAIRETEDDRLRLVDVGIKVRGIATSDLMEHLQDVELLDSGYMLHLLQKGVSKGNTLVALLGMMGERNLALENVMVFGDSTTDLSLFKRFTHSVLVVNPRLPASEVQALERVAQYESELSMGEGFAQVVNHLLKVRH
ncbi:MAG: HAD hydrolase family protein [Chloroflexota bacterium]|nr:HAD hydrolase family protein [Chloroflexota bacterium]